MDAELIRHLVEAQPDILLVELQSEAAEHGLRASTVHLRRITGAVDHTGLLPTMTMESATDGDVFLAFLNQVLCLKLRSGPVVVTDILSAHRVDGVRVRIEACGAPVLCRPPCSPGLNPIEKSWSKLKARLRALAARAMPQLKHRIAPALQTLTPQDAKPGPDSASAAVPEGKNALAA